MAVPQKPGGGFNRPASGGAYKPGGGGFNKGGYRGRFAPRKEAEHRINNFIRVPQVRLVGENIEPGIFDTQTALKMAQDMELDLVEISPTVDPPVCKIIDYNKFLYDKKRKEKEMKAGNKVKAYVQFKGRAIQFQDRGQLLLLKFAERLAEVGILESMPKMEGRRMLAMFAPKGKKKS